VQDARLDTSFVDYAILVIAALLPLTVVGVVDEELASQEPSPGSGRDRAGGGGEGDAWWEQGEH
jgi:hypothetical protein